MRRFIPVLALAACSFAHAQHPAKPVRMVVAFTAGIAGFELD